MYMHREGEAVIQRKANKSLYKACDVIWLRLAEVFLVDKLLLQRIVRSLKFISIGIVRPKMRT